MKNKKSKSGKLDPLATAKRLLVRAERAENYTGCASLLAFIGKYSGPDGEVLAQRDEASKTLVEACTPEELAEIDRLCDQMDALKARVLARVASDPRPPEPAPRPVKIPDPMPIFPQDARPAEDERELPPIVIAPEPREDDDVYEWTEEEVDTPDDSAT